MQGRLTTGDVTEVLRAANARVSCPAPLKSAEVEAVKQQWDFVTTCIKVFMSVQLAPKSQEMNEARDAMALFCTEDDLMNEIVGLVSWAPFSALT